MQKSLGSFLSQQFHKDYSSILFESFNLLVEFVDTDEQILIDAREFPTINVQPLKTKEIIELIPQHLIKDFAANLARTTESIHLLVYLYDESMVLYLFDQDSKPYRHDTESKAYDEMVDYIKAYLKGLVKEAYDKADETGLPHILTSIDGETSYLNDEEAVKLLSQNNNFDFEDWVETCVAGTESLLSYLYIDNRQGVVWYYPLPSTYEELINFFTKG